MIYKTIKQQLREQTGRCWSDEEILDLVAMAGVGDEANEYYRSRLAAENEYTKTGFVVTLSTTTTVDPGLTETEFEQLYPPRDQPPMVLSLPVIGVAALAWINDGGLCLATQVEGHDGWDRSINLSLPFSAFSHRDERGELTKGARWLRLYLTATKRLPEN